MGDGPIRRRRGERARLVATGKRTDDGTRSTPVAVSETGGSGRCSRTAGPSSACGCPPRRPRGSPGPFSASPELLGDVFGAAAPLSLKWGTGSPGVPPALRDFLSTGRLDPLAVPSRLQRLGGT